MTNNQVKRNYKTPSNHSRNTHIKGKIQQGFTILEVVIVLSIAAIVMVAVFLVVPQVQRNQRNSRAQIVARHSLTAAENFASSNRGVYPTVGSDISNITGTQMNGSITYTYSVISTAPLTPDTSIVYLIAAGTCTNTVVTFSGSRFVVAVALENANPPHKLFCVSL